MSLFCGIFSFDAKAEIRPEWRAYLQQNLSRGEGSITEYSDSHLYLAKLDLGGFDGSGWLSDESGATAMSGDSLLADREPSTTRESDVRRLHALRSLSGRLGAELREARGTFCAAAYRALDGELALATDKLGVRPIYWMSDGRSLVFAGALRLLENLPNVALEVDLRGAMEQVCFGFPLADRTQYAQIHSMRGGEILTCRAGGGGRVRADTYWRWDRDACSTIEDDVERAVRRLHQTFARSVELRARGRKAAFASLSGGLDSRCVVTQLRSMGLSVDSINVSWRGTADQVLGAMYAKAVGTNHHEVTLPMGETGQSVPYLAWQTMAQLGREMIDKGGHPRQLWGGDGGSVGIGHVYMKPATVQALRDQGTRAGARRFLKDNSFALAARVFRSRFVPMAHELPVDSIVAELERHHCADPGRALFIFLLENDQRRHTAAYFETLDRVPLEFVEPFYDAEVLSAVCKLPLDFCLRHRMYNQWLHCFAPQATQIPWQHYPGHEECPVPMPSILPTQWSQNSRVLDRRRRSNALGNLRTALKNRSSLTELLRPEVLAAAYLAIGLRVSDAFWVGDQVGALSRPFIRCNGRFALSSG